MGRSITPKYVVHMEGCTPACWWVRENGKPTLDNLEKYVMAYAASLGASGVNSHISKSLGYVPYPRWARIRKNTKTGVVLAEWKAAMFQCYSSLPSVT